MSCENCMRHRPGILHSSNTFICPECDQEYKKAGVSPGNYWEKIELKKSRIKTMKIFYIAGPYRADTPRKILENIRAAEAVAIEVWKSGHVALCPHLNSRFMDSICDDSIFLEGAIELMKRCDAVALVPGWEKSKGTLIEIEIAKKIKLSIYVNYNKLFQDTII